MKPFLIIQEDRGDTDLRSIDSRLPGEGEISCVPLAEGGRDRQALARRQVQQMQVPEAGVGLGQALAPCSAHLSSPAGVQML